MRCPPTITTGSDRRLIFAGCGATSKHEAWSQCCLNVGPASFKQSRNNASLPVGNERRSDISYRLPLACWPLTYNRVQSVLPINAHVLYNIAINWSAVNVIIHSGISARDFDCLHGELRTVWRVKNKEGSFLINDIYTPSQLLSVFGATQTHVSHIMLYEVT